MSPVQQVLVGIACVGAGALASSLAFWCTTHLLYWISLWVPVLPPPMRRQKEKP